MENLKVAGFTLVNADKVQRALEGQPTPSGENKGGIARPDGSYDDMELLAEYDRMGGLIKKGTDNLKVGSFWDFKAKKPHAEPKVVFLYRVNGQLIEVPDGSELPGLVKASRILAEANAEAQEEAPKKRKSRKA